MQCLAIGTRTGTQCKRSASPGGDLCKTHLREWGLLPHEPTLPPKLRTTPLDMIGELEAARNPVKPAPGSRHVSRAEFETDPDSYIFVCGTDTPTLRCSAMSKRSRVRCKAPAVRGRKTCRFHGGKSCGPVTPEGKARSGFQPVHGRETVKIRELRSLKSREFRVLKRVIKEHGL
jgi:hypothetical protein